MDRAKGEARRRVERVRDAAHPSRVRRLFTLALTLAALALPVRARATEPLATSLNWVRLPGAEACSPAATLGRAVEARLGRALLVSAAAAQLTVEARIEHGEPPAPRWRVVIRVIDANNALLGTRELTSEAPECAALDASLALVIAVMIDPELPMRPPAPPVPVAVAPPAPAPRVIVRRERVLVPVRVPPPRPGPWQFDVGVAGRAALGLVPGATAGLGLFARVTPPFPVAFELGGSGWLDAQATVAGRGGTLSPLLANFAACPELRFARAFRLAGCAGIEAGLIRASGLGLDVSQEVTEPVVFGTLRARIAWQPVGPLAFHASVGASIAAVQPRFYYDDDTNPAAVTRQYFYQVPALGAWFELGVAFHFSS